MSEANKTNSMHKFYRLVFDPLEPLRNSYSTASSLATSLGWSPYKTNAPVSSFMANRGYAMEAKVIELLKEDFAKVEKSFVCDALKVIGTPDIISIKESKLFPKNTYGEIKGVFLAGKNLDERFYFFLDSRAFDLDKIIAFRKESNLFSHVVQCLVNMYCSRIYHRRRCGPDFYLFHSVNANGDLVAQKLSITQEGKFMDWVERALRKENVHPEEVRDFLECKPFIYSNKDC